MPVENHPALWIKDFPLPEASRHKYDRGHVVVVAGKKRAGAACLAAFAAQKAGAGVVSLLSPPESALVCRCYRASIMVDEWREGRELAALLRDPHKNTVVIGPGLGTDSDARAAVEAVLPLGLPVVWDGDIFTLYKDDPEVLFSQLSAKDILTPHEGEFARIFPDISGDKLERARLAAKRCSAVVLLKGSDTVIANPDGRVIVNRAAPPTLATAGAGDVLAGLIAGIMAQGMEVFTAAAAASWLHADSAGRYGLGLTAEDIIQTLPQALEDLCRISRVNG